MIAASEPLEFVPHGRTVLAKHPGQIYGKHNTSVSENSLLYKLTNFAIKDESLLADHSDRESWSIREVYYRDVEEVDDEPTPPKESKFDFNSESFRPPSRLRPDFNISIKSELLSKKLDEGNSAGPSRGSSANSSSNMSKKFNLNSKTNEGEQKKPLNPKTDCFYEEELYVKGCTAVWSKGLISTPATKLSAPEHRETICCYTIENPIKHALFANFHVDIKNTMLIDALNSQISDVKKNIKIEDTTEHIKTDMMPSIVLLDSKCLRVYAADGREYITSVPFQVKKVWSMKYGVLLEKDATPVLHNSMLPNSFLRMNDTHNSFNRSRNFNTSARLQSEMSYEHDVPLPTCFSLTHPLDEVTPILMKSPSQGLQYYNDGDLQIIFVNTNPSIILLYDWKLALHSLWRIRKATRDECLSMCPNMNATTTLFSQSCDYIGSPMESNRNATSWATGLGSPYQSKKTNTPTRLRITSPMANMFHHLGMSPHASIGQASSMSMMANSMSQTPPTLPLYPDVCIDHIWTDSITIRRDKIESPSDTKTFLHTDLVGHEYLCFIVKVSSVSKLQILRLQKSHCHGQPSKTTLIVGTVSTVLAKDAVVLPHLKMIALIDETGNIILQSGNSVVGKVHVGGVLARLIDSPYTKRSTFQSPFPRRSSLLPSRRDETTSFDDSALHLLSPVPHTSASRIEKESLGLSGVRDAAGSRFTVECSSGAMYRISLPGVSSSALVTHCLSALTAILPRDVTMQVIIKWYGVRNAPGTQDLTQDQEWKMFSDLLLGFIGYDTERLNRKQSDEDHTETVSKKQRTSSDGTLEDWEYLTNSKLHRTIGHNLSDLLKLPVITDESRHKHITFQEEEKSPQFNSNSLLTPYILQVLYSFHLVYEEIKLNTLLWSNLKHLSQFLYQIAKDLSLESYINHYWLDFPADLSIEVETESQIPDEVVKRLSQPSYFSKEPPNVFSYLNSMFKDVDVGYYPYLADVNNMSKDLIEVFTISGCGRTSGVQTVTRRDTLRASTPRPTRGGQGGRDHCGAARELTHRGITPRTIDNLPPAISLHLSAILSRCKMSAAEWNPPPAACALLRREDIAIHQQVVKMAENTDEQVESLALGELEKETAYSVVNTPEENKNEENENNTGMEHLNTKLLSLLFPRDHRMTEVVNLLQSSQPVVINLTQRPEVSDHDFIEEQEKYLYALSTRTTALPIARGMVTVRTVWSAPHTAQSVPRVCVWGRSGRSAAVAGGEGSGPALAWPAFHSGAAAGLALVAASAATLPPCPPNVKGGEMSPEHGGFLLALGLHGYLKDMPFMNMYEHLVKCNEMLSVGLLLGLAATYRGTMDIQATKLMSIHLEPLLPPTSIELDIQQNILVAALLGVGLVYQGTAHNHYSQVLLNEIGKPPGPEMENCSEREGYALAAGLALGMVQAGRGDDAPPHIASQLRTYMLGGDKYPLTGQRDKYRQAAWLREGTPVNVDVTSPGATLALGLQYLRTGAAAPASWLLPPHTSYWLDCVRPDLLLLRLVARGLILWHDIEATEEWVENQVPETIKPYVFVKPTEDNIDYEAMNHAYCNIIAGACFAMGLRFAGSGDTDARDVTLHYARLFVTLGSRSLAELAGRATLEACETVCLLAAAMIMAGRGDLEVLRVCRRLRARVPAPRSAQHAPLTHGGQMAVHIAVGLLFLGGCRATLSTTPEAIGALLAAFFPKFPTHSEDNRYHLQAFRHLYVLAVEPRLFLPRDLNTGKLCYAHIQVVDLSGAVKQMKAPCILPELATLREVRVNDPRYWPVCFQRDRNWQHLKTFVQYTWCVDVKQRVGCYSYADDPHGFLTILAHTLTVDDTNVWSGRPENIELFTNDEKIRNFVKYYLNEESSGLGRCADCLVVPRRRRAARVQCACRETSARARRAGAALAVLVRRAAATDALPDLPAAASYLKHKIEKFREHKLDTCALELTEVWAGIKIIRTMKTEPTSYHMWQIKLLLSQIEYQNKRTFNEMPIDGQEQYEPLLSNEFALAIKQKVCHIFDSWDVKLSPYLRKYLGLSSSRKLNNCEDNLKRFLSAYVVYHDLQRDVLKDCPEDELSVVLNMNGLSSEALSKVESVVR